MLGHLTQLLPLAALLCLLAAGGCSDRADTGGDARADRVLVRGNGGEPGSLDPARATDIHAFNLLGDLHEGLVTLDAAGEPAPGIAERWSHDAALRRFTFRLRDGLRWSNGDPLTADDVVRGLRRAADPATNAPYAPLLAGIAGFDAVSAGAAPPGALAVSAPDARTVVIELERPGHTLLQVLALPIATPVHAAMRDGDFDDPAAFIGNGPYRLAFRRANDRIRVEANPHHRDAGTLGFCNVEFLPITDPNLELTLFRTGELDVTQSIPPARLELLQTEMPDAIRIAPLLGVYFVAFDTTEPALADPRFRAALSLAIDRRALTALLGRGERPAYGLLPPGVTGDDDGYPWSTLNDAARESRARRLRDEALAGAPAPEVRLVYDAGDVHGRIALAISDMWRDVLGVETTLDKREWGYFLETRGRRDEWDAMRYAWFADYPDPVSFLDLFRAGSEHNLPGLVDPEYDALLDAAAGSTDPAARREAIGAAAERLRGQYAFAPLYFFVSKHLVRPGIAGFTGNPLDRHPSRYLRERGVPPAPCPTPDN